MTPELMHEKKNLTQWSQTTGIKVLDPDGWREAGVEEDEPITLSRFRELCATSTITYGYGVTWR